MNGTSYVLEKDLPGQKFQKKGGTKPAVHRFHLYLCEHGINQEIFYALLNKDYDINGFLLSLSIAPADQYDSKLYIPTLENFKIKRHIGRPANRPSMISADTAYDTTEIREYNHRRCIKSNIPINKSRYIIEYPHYAEKNIIHLIT